MTFYKHKQLHNPLPLKAIVTMQKLEQLLGTAVPVNKQHERRGSPEGAIEARRLIAEAQKRFEQQQQENAVKSNHLQAVIDHWDNDDKSLSTTKEQPAMTTQPQFFQVTNGVTQATFNYVKDNPGLTSAQISENMKRLGYKATSTSSLVYQMARQGLLHKDNENRFTAIAREYSPLKGKLNRKPIKPAHRVDIPRGTHGIAALTPSATPTVIPPTPSAAPPILTAKYIMETLSIKEAHALYREMQSMFGG